MAPQSIYPNLMSMDQSAQESDQLSIATQFMNYQIKTTIGTKMDNLGMDNNTL